MKLPGFRTGDALASAVLAAAAPKRMAVFDHRAQQALDSLHLTLTPAPGRYMDLLDQVLTEGGHRTEDWTVRDLDTVLYWIDGSSTGKTDEKGHSQDDCIKRKTQPGSTGLMSG